MPGVLSRKCDTCRKAKKKCDQAKPICSRCSQRRLPCHGSGQQRFTFKHQTEALAVANATALPSSTHPPPKKDDVDVLPRPGWNKGLHVSVGPLDYFFENAGRYEGDGEFEDGLLLTACLQVILESLLDPLTNPNPRSNTILPRFNNPSSNSMLPTTYFANLPLYICNPSSHISDILSIYSHLQSDITRTLDALTLLAFIPSCTITQRSYPTTLAQNHAATASQPTPPITKYQTHLATLLSITTILNRILRIHDPFDEDITTDSTILTTRVLTLATQALAYRPLENWRNMNALPLCLAISWAAISHLPHQRGKEKEKEMEDIKVLMEEWNGAYPAGHWMEVGQALMRGFEIAEARFYCVDVGRLGSGVLGVEMRFGVGRGVGTPSALGLESCARLIDMDVTA